LILNFTLYKKLLILFLFVFLNVSLFSQEISPSKIDTISLIAVGDIMMGTDFPRNLLPPNNGRNLLKGVEHILMSADITFGNLEGVLLDGGIPRKECKDTTTCYIFRTPTRYAENLKNSGFDVMSLSNNHSNDFGDTGRVTSRKALTDYGIKYAGIKDEIVFLNIKNKRIGVIAFSISEDCYSILDISKAQDEIRKLNSLCDITIVSFHGGAEGEDTKHVAGENEIMFEEDRGNVLVFARAVVDAGADIVIGHGPHVPRAIELYKDRLIAYSLGNFCTYRGFSILDSRGIAPIIKINFDDTGKFINGEIISAKQLRPGGTVLDKKNRALKLITKLTNEDFPGTNLLIDSSGYFERKKTK